VYITNYFEAHNFHDIVLYIKKNSPQKRHTFWRLSRRQLSSVKKTLVTPYMATAIESWSRNENVSEYLSTIGFIRSYSLQTVLLLSRSVSENVLNNVLIIELSLF